MGLTFRNLPKELQVEVDIVDREMSCRRPLMANNMQFSGDKIIYDFNESKLDLYYFIELGYINLDNRIRQELHFLDKLKPMITLKHVTQPKGHFVHVKI